MNAIESIKAVSRVKLNRQPAPEPETDNYRVGYETANEFRYRCGTALFKFRPSDGDHRQLGDAVVTQAKLISELSSGELSTLADAVASEWEALTAAVTEHRKKLSIAESNARGLITKLNEHIIRRVIKDKQFNMRLARVPDDETINSFCRVLGECGVVISSRTFGDIIESGRMADLIKLHRNEAVDMNQNQLRILWRQTVGETNRLT